MQSVKVKARIHSLDGEMDEVTVVEKREGNNYIVEYKGQKCTAIFNGITNCFYVASNVRFIDKRCFSAMDQGKTIPEEIF